MPFALANETKATVLLLIDEHERRAYHSVWDARPLHLPVLPAGGVWPLSVGVMSRIRRPFDSRIFSPIELDDWVIQAAIGGGFVLPVAGSIPFGYAGDSVYGASHSPTATELALALNSLDSIEETGGVSVTGAEGFFVVTFLAHGERELITADPALLVPLSIVNVQQVVAGDAETSAVQVIRLTQNVASLATLATDSSDAEATVEVVQQGGAGQNHKVRIALPAHRYAGEWTYTADGEAAEPIGWDDSPEQIKRILEAVSGAGNVSVSQETENTFLVTYAGEQDVPVTVDGSTLKVLSLKSGNLDLRTAGVEMLLNGRDSVVATLEIEGTPATGLPQKLLRQDVLLTRTVRPSTVALPSEDTILDGGIL